MDTPKKNCRAMEDPTMADGYIDADEQRLRVLPDGTGLPYRYVHGGDAAPFAQIRSVARVRIIAES